MSAAPAAASPRLVRIDHWIFASHATSAESLSLYRILYGLFLLVFAMPDPAWVASLPDAVYDPPAGPLRLLDGFPPLLYFQLLGFALCVAAVALVLGFRTRRASIAVGLLIPALIGFEFCFGKVDHNRHLLFLTPLALAASAWGDRFSVDRARGRVGGGDAAHWPLALLALLIGFFFASSAAPKILGGWLDPRSHAFEYYATRADAPLLPLIQRFGGPVAFELADWCGVLFESGFLVLVLFGLRATRLACAVAVLFHLVNVLVLKIDFPEMAIVYGAFVDWRRAPGAGRVAALAERAARAASPRPWLLVLALGSAAFALHAGCENPLRTSRSTTTAERLAYWSGPCAVALWYLARRLRQALGRLGSGERAAAGGPLHR